MCINAEQIKCTQDIKVNNSLCYEKCEGLQILNFNEKHLVKEISRFVAKRTKEYSNYQWRDLNLSQYEGISRGV